MRSGVSKAGSWAHRAILIGGDAVILLGAFQLGLEYWVQKVGPNAGEFFPTAVIWLGEDLLAFSMLDLLDLQRNYLSQRGSTGMHIAGPALTAGGGLSGLVYVSP